MPTSKKTKKKSSSPLRFDGSKYNYQGTKFGYKNKNKLKSEYKSAKQNTVKYKELMEWKQKQQTAFQMSNHPSEPQEPLTLEPVETTRATRATRACTNHEPTSTSSSISRKTTNELL